MSMIDIDKHFLYPANIWVAQQPTIISTLLGTCVAVCLWDSRAKIGGMNHYLLPLWNGDGLASPKYGNIAIHKLVDEMQAQGASPKRMVAKIFGGKTSQKGGSVAYSIGLRNIQIAKEMLEELQIPLLAESVGGEYGRTIKFDTESGKVYMKLIQGS
ncbi:chemotaxis protein CheD [Cytophagales bacterium LB-30]|uniref:Probable chemoreceptor glutamine deamidase CheD n=1 Tax=Shiella aurantiaca TaxID=3058365 RepID=A0ABT8F6Y1_9BACT|nr:chemotaxis protein CheD [Shiella aurantiaca]MDN4166129.1 chemotaxis protein CheD [Shiella aurantiaca]